MTHRAALETLLDRVTAGDATAPDFHDVLGRNALNAISASNGSLDAAKALHDAVLPGWIYIIDWQVAGVSTPDYNDPRWWNVMHKEAPARAWLIAILKAMIATHSAASDPS